MMQACWTENPINRPTFTNLKAEIEAVISKETPYLDFKVDETKACYSVPSFNSLETDKEGEVNEATSK